MLEVQGVAAERTDNFPYSGIRVLGTIQMSVGLIVFLLGVIDLVVTMTSYTDDVTKYGSEYETIVTMTVASSPLWCGMWFAISGSLGMCISRRRAHSLQFFKLSFLVLNILCAALFAPVCAVLGALIAFARHDLDPAALQWMVSMLVCFLGVLEIVIAVASASVTCCCSPLKATQVHVIVNPPGRSSQGRDYPRSTSTLTGPHSEDAARSQRPHHHYNSYNNNDNNSNNNAGSHGAQTPDQDNVIRDDGHFQERPPTNAVDGFSDSGGYPKLKKWALPGW